MDIQSKIEKSASESNFFEYGYVKVEHNIIPDIAPLKELC